MLVAGRYSLRIGVLWGKWGRADEMDEGDVGGRPLFPRLRFGFRKNRLPGTVSIQTLWMMTALVSVISSTA